MKEKESCRCCRFVGYKSVLMVRGGIEDQQMVTVCRRNPPVHVRDGRFEFPRVADAEWCGRFRPNQANREQGDKE